MDQGTKGMKMPIGNEKNNNKNKNQCLPGPGGKTPEQELTGQPDCSVELAGLFVP